MKLPFIRDPEWRFAIMVIGGALVAATIVGNAAFCIKQWYVQHDWLAHWVAMAHR